MKGSVQGSGKLNLSLLVIVLSLVGINYFVFEKDAQKDIYQKRQAEYLIPIDTLSQWRVVLAQGSLSLKNEVFTWDDHQDSIKEISAEDKRVQEFYRRLRDLKIIRQIKEIKTIKSWGRIILESPELQPNKREFEFGELNELTGRMKVKDILNNRILLIDDESVLKNPYKSFEIGQKIKFSKLKSLIQKLKMK